VPVQIFPGAKKINESVVSSNKVTNNFAWMVTSGLGNDGNLSVGETTRLGSVDC
jgi:hypothetical protein